MTFNWLDFLGKGATWTTLGSIAATIVAVLQHQQSWVTAIPAIILAISSLFNAAHNSQLKAQLRAKSLIPGGRP